MALKRRPEEEDEAELWVASYADMMSLLLCFFIIFFSISSAVGSTAEDIKRELVETFTDQKSTKVSKSDVGMRNETKEARALQLLVAMLNLDETAGDVDRLAQRRNDTQDLSDAKQLLKQRLGEDADEKMAAVGEQLNDDRTVDVILPSSALFDPGAATLKPESVVKLRKLTQQLLKSLDLADLEVRGHTDPTTPGKDSVLSDNWALSTARAGAVAAKLIEFGFDPAKIRAVGYGATRPMYPNKDAQGRWVLANLERNRRVELVLKRRAR